MKTHNSRIIPRFAPYDDPHWLGENDTIRGSCEDGYHLVIRKDGTSRCVHDRKEKPQKTFMSFEDAKIRGRA